MGIKIKEWDIVCGINVTTIYSNPVLKVTRPVYSDFIRKRNMTYHPFF